MAFTVEDFEDLQRLLAAHPEWRAQLRPLILGDEFLQVPARLNAIDERLERMSQSLVVHDQRLGVIDERLDRITALLAQMAERQNRMEGRTGHIEGDLLEARYERNMREWFADYLWPIDRVFTGELFVLRERLSASELQNLRAIHMILRGKDQRDSGQDLLVVLEISQTINTDDVDRALERARLLEKAGYRARAAVGGYRVAPGVESRAKELGVIVDLRRFVA